MFEKKIYYNKQIQKVQKVLHYFINQGVILPSCQPFNDHFLIDDELGIPNWQ